MRYVAIGVALVIASPLLALVLGLYGVYAAARWGFLRLAFPSKVDRERALWATR